MGTDFKYGKKENGSGSNFSIHIDADLRNFSYLVTIKEIIQKRLYSRISSTWSAVVITSKKVT